MQKYWIGALSSLVISLVASHGRANAHTPRRPVGTSAASSLPHNRIYNGTDTHACAWPTAVLVLLPDAICTGTLVHPNIVVYAAHCGTGVESILFGEDVRGPVFGVGGEPSWVAQPDYCKVYPGHDPLGGTDFAYCKLREPVTQVPVVPILMGCEQAALRAGKEVVMVGFGQDQDDNVAIKEEVRSTEGAPASLKVFVGGDGNDTCFGDSGGPVFVQLTASDGLAGTADNSWRVFALTSYGLTSACGDGSFDSLTYLGVPWIEQDSGVDITPCFDAYGHWDPGPSCGQFPTNPGQGGATWTTGCSGAPTRLSGAGATCGAAYDPISPMVTFVAPNAHAGMAYARPMDVMLRATDAQGDPLADVHVAVDGVPLTAAAHAPPAYNFTQVTLAPGNHVMTATAADRSGHVTTSRLTVLVSDDEAEHGATGCAAAGAGAHIWAAGLLACIWAYRRQRSTRAIAVGLLVVASTAACGSHHPEHVSLSVTSGGANAAEVVPPQWLQPPRVGAQIAGRNGTFGFDHIASAIFGYGMQEGEAAPVLLVMLSDQPDACALLAHGQARPGAQSLILEFTNTSLTGEDQPTEGAFTVPQSDPSSGSPGHYLAAGCSRHGAHCEQTLPSEDVFADAGSVHITTSITHAGAFVSGTVAGLRFGDDAKLLTGHFVAEHCNIGRAQDINVCF